MQFESAAAKFSKSSLVWTALRATRNLQELGGTVGGLIAVTWKPACNKCRLACSALSSVPTIRDMMGLVTGIPVSK